MDGAAGGDFVAPEKPGMLVQDVRETGLRPLLWVGTYTNRTVQAHAFSNATVGRKDDRTVKWVHVYVVTS